MAFAKPYTLDFGPTGDTRKQAIDKLEDNIDDIYVNLNNSIIKTSTNEGKRVEAGISSFTATTGDNSLEVNFTTAFAAAPAVIATFNYGGGAGNFSYTVASTTTKFTFYLNVTSVGFNETVYFSWIAIGN